MGTNIYLLLLIWILSSVVSNVPVDNKCFREYTHLQCANIILEKNITELSNLPATGVDALSFTGATGSFDFDISNYPSLARVRSLALNDSNIDHFELKMKPLRSLYLVHCNLPVLHFENCCQNLEKLYLKHNSGVPIAPRTFVELKCLKKLKIVNQPLNHISRQTFDGLHRLKRLTIDNTSITSIDDDAFTSLNHLSELFLQDHTLDHIDENVFRPLEKLKSLTIYGDNLRTLSLGHFKKQKKLKQLGLPLETWRHIDIHQIPVAFPNLHSFTYIGEWKNEEDRNYFEGLFLNLHSLLIDK